jgi:cytoskeletal protein RodZ
MESHDTEVERELRQALHTSAEPVSGEGVRQDMVRQTVARRRRTRRTIRLSLIGVAAAAAVVVGFLVSSGGDDRLRTVNRPPGPSTSSTTTAAPEPEEQPDPSTTSSTSTPDSTTSASSTSTPSSSTSTSTSTSTTTEPPLPAFPPVTNLTHGGTAWALYLAVVPEGQSDAPEYQAALAASAEAGYGGFGGGGLACDQGAAEALGRDPDSMTVSVYFGSQAQAEQARAAFEARNRSVVGVVLVRTYCLD